MENQIQGPAWDLSSEYASTNAAELEADLKEVMSLCAEIESRNGALAGDERISTAQEVVPSTS